MKKLTFFKIIIIVALAVILFDIAAVIAVGIKLIVFSKAAIIVTPFVFAAFITVLSINAALLILIVVYLFLRKA